MNGKQYNNKDVNKMTYEQEQLQKLTEKLKAIEQQLPSFCKDYFSGIERTTQIKTRVAYAQDLIMFFGWIKNELHKNITVVTDLETITSEEIDQYLNYLVCYTVNGKTYTNSNAGLKRKLMAIKAMYTYFVRRKRIKENPASYIDTPEIKEKPITRLEEEEQNKFFNLVEIGKNNKFTDVTKRRDIAIVSVALGTGMRVSEIVGININDVEFIDNIEGVAGLINITRKGGNHVKLYFGEDVGKVLKAYIAEREDIITKPGHEDALFLSIQKQRINPQSVERVVKQYAQQVTSKHITPHKLRSTYGTNLYKETGDIYLVASVLGHKDVNTTKKHYADIDDEKRQQAARAIKIK
jgi:site-specific recombinase XerD